MHQGEPQGWAWSFGAEFRPVSNASNASTTSAIKNIVLVEYFLMSWSKSCGFVWDHYPGSSSRTRMLPTLSMNLSPASCFQSFSVKWYLWSLYLGVEVRLSSTFLRCSWWLRQSCLTGLITKSACNSTIPDLIWLRASKSCVELSTLEASFAGWIMQSVRYT